jgi:hypothetical protein
MRTVMTVLLCMISTTAAAQTSILSEQRIVELERRIYRLEQIRVELEDQIERLEDRIRELEDAQRPLEARRPAAETNNATPPSEALLQGWTQPENWRNLQRGMTMADVRALMGEPGSDGRDRGIIFWRYPEGGSIQFDTRTETVIGWIEPNR